jgi:hypothetical protein
VHCEGRDLPGREQCVGDHPEFVAEIVEASPFGHPLPELSVIRHEPDNRFLECALSVEAEFIVTVNTAPGHFDRKQYQSGMGFSCGSRPRVNDPYMILATVGMSEKQNPLLVGRTNCHEPLFVQRIRIVERQRERIGEHAGGLLE